MLLSSEEVRIFYKLHGALMRYVQEELNAPGGPDPAASYSTVAPEKRHELRQLFLQRRDLLDSFIASNPAQLSQDELSIVSSWRHFVTGRFIALRQLKKHMILLAGEGDAPTVYGVTGLVDPIERLISPPLPKMIETLLLPFRDKLIYDGLVIVYSITFGAGARRGFEEQFRMAKANHAVVTSLPANAVVVAQSSGPQKRAPRKPAPLPAADTREILQRVIALTDDFCRQFLTQEYSDLCRKLAEKLAAKRPSPLLRGKLETWACGIVRTIGWVNFLDHRSQSPHVKFPLIDRFFGVAESTGQAKAKAVRQLVKIHQFDHRWTLPSRWDDNPLIWTVHDESGLLIDIREQPPAVQRSAFRQGRIPYVPADRAAAAVQERISSNSTRVLFQFKVVLRGTDPVIWRRIQVFDDTLDRLHEHIQNAMGWNNSHLHEFSIQGQRYGDPELLHDDPEPFTGGDSTKTLISEVLPPDGAPLTFEYHYDFGDDWKHDVLWEGCPAPQAGVVYPQCLEGERACPPEDVGGIWGFQEYLEALADPEHERHQEMLDWNGPYNPGAFSPRAATHVMQEGMPDWRKADK